MTVEKITANKMSVDKIYVEEMSVDQMAAGKMTQDKTILDKMTMETRTVDKNVIGMPIYFTFSHLFFDDNITQTLENLFRSRASKWGPQRQHVRLDPRLLGRALRLSVAENLLLL